MRKGGDKLLVVFTVLGLAVTCVSGFGLFDALLLEPNWVTVEKVRIKNPGLGQALAGVKIVQISDIHLAGAPGYRETVLIGKLNRLQPDLILITGDLVEDKEGASLAANFLSRLKPGLWCYGILGNSDMTYLNNGWFKELWKRSGLSLIGGRLLRMGGKEGASFWLAGLDFPGYETTTLEEQVDDIFQGVPPGAPLICLSYSPDLAPLLIEKGAVLVLSGDTHGGQVAFPGWSKLFRQFGRSEFVRGLYRINDGYLYVNRGIGTKLLPIRFLCPPEITVFQFTS